MVLRKARHLEKGDEVAIPVWTPLDHDGKRAMVADTMYATVASTYSSSRMFYCNIGFANGETRRFHADDLIELTENPVMTVRPKVAEVAT